MTYLVVAAIALQICLCIVLFKSAALNRILSFSIVFYSSFWIIIPGMISMMIHANLLGENFSSDAISDAYAILYGMESLIFFAAVMGASAIARRLIRAKVPRHRKPAHLSVPRIVLYVFLLLTAALYLSGFGSNYLDRNDASAYDEQRNLVLLELVCRIFASASIYFYVTLKKKPSLSGLFLAALVLSAAIQTLYGSRIAMLLPVFAYLCRVHYQSTNLRKTAYRMAMVSLLVASIALPVALVIGKIRADGRIDVDAIAEGSSEAIVIADLAADVYTKFNSFSSGLQLIDGYGTGTAGILPYIGSVMVFLPRAIFPDRPVAGSIDGTIYGTPSRLVPQLFESSESMNVGVSPLAIAVWQFGWALGSVLLLIAGAANILMLQLLFSRAHLAFKVVAIHNLSIPTFLGVFNSPDSLLLNAVQVAFVCTMLFLVSAAFAAGLRRHSASRNPLPTVL